MKYRIKDLNLYPSGLDKIEWVKRNMHVLYGIEQSFIKEQPFKVSAAVASDGIHRAMIDAMPLLHYRDIVAKKFRLT